MSGYKLHPTAIVDDGAQIGQNSRVWHWTHVSATAQIGEACSLGQNVYIADHVKIGNKVKIQNNVSVYEKVELEDNVFCGPSMVFTNVYNPRSSFERKDEYLKTRVKEGATLGANCTVVCGVTLGRHCFVGAGALVNKDIPDFALVVGVPAKQIAWMTRFGKKIEIPFGESGVYTCPHTEDKYLIENNSCKLMT